MLYINYIIKSLSHSLNAKLILGLWFFFDPIQCVVKKTLLERSKQVTLINLKPHFTFFKFFLNIKKSNLHGSYNSLFWYSYYIALYLKNYLGMTLRWVFLNLEFKKSSTDLLYVWRRTYKTNFLKHYFLSAWYYFYILTQLFYTKSLKDFIKIVSMEMTAANIKYHKRLFYEFGSIVRNYYNLLLKFNRIKGFKLYFKGKLGRKGSVKKSIIRISGGRMSTTNKQLRFNHSNFLVFTETGVVGCYLSIFF